MVASLTMETFYYQAFLPILAWFRFGLGTSLKDSCIRSLTSPEGGSVGSFKGLGVSRKQFDHCGLGLQEELKSRHDATHCNPRP